MIKHGGKDIYNAFEATHALPVPVPVPEPAAALPPPTKQPAGPHIVDTGCGYMGKLGFGRFLGGRTRRRSNNKSKLRKTNKKRSTRRRRHRRSNKK